MYNLNRDHGVSFQKKKKNQTPVDILMVLLFLMRIMQTENNKLTQKRKKFMSKRQIFNESVMSILQNLIQITGNAFPNRNISSGSQLLHHYVFTMSYLKAASTTSETMYPEPGFKSRIFINAHWFEVMMLFSVPGAEKK